MPSCHWNGIQALIDAEMLALERGGLRIASQAYAITVFANRFPRRLPSALQATSRCLTARTDPPGTQTWIDPLLQQWIR